MATKQDLDKFIAWLQEELIKRGWSQSKAAEYGDISPSMYYQVTGGYANPGLKFYRGVAQALFGSAKMGLENVLRHAGELPPLEDVPQDQRAILLEYFTRLSEEGRGCILNYVRWLKDQETVRAAALANTDNDTDPEPPGD